MRISKYYLETTSRGQQCIRVLRELALKYTVQNNGMFWAKKNPSPETLTSVDSGELRTNTDKVVNFLFKLSCLSGSRWVG